MNEEMKVKVISDVTKSFCNVVGKIIEPHGLDKAILNSNVGIIEEISKSSHLNPLDKAAIINNYKQIIKEYKNCEEVIEKAKAFLSLKADPKKVDEDWFTFFFDKVKLISNENVQEMWAKILAGEVNQPGKFSKSLIHSLSVIDDSQARVFCNISRYCMHEKNSENIHPIIFIASNVDTYKALGIDFESLIELQNLGLLQCNFEKEFIFTGRKYLVYGNRVIEVYGTQKSKKKIKVGNVLLTKNGQTLYEIVEPIYKEFDNNILEFIVDKLIKRKCEIIINNKRID